MKINHTQSILLGASLLVLSSASSFASSVVSWSGDYSSAVNPFYNLGTLETATVYTTDDTLIRPYSETTSLNPTSFYTAPSGKSGTFYGAIQASGENETPGSFQNARVFNDASGDRLNLPGVPTTTGNTSTAKAFISFLKADFLNGFDSTTTGLSSIDTISLNVPLSTNATLVRMAAKSSGQWYLSESSITSSVSQTFTISDPDSVNWAAWTPATSGLFNAAPATFSIVGSDLTDIEGFGFYSETQRDGSAVAPFFRIDDFTVSAIPEPSQASFLILGFVATMIASRHLRRNAYRRRS